LFVFSVKLNGKRHITGVLRGYDPFMNLVMEETVEEISPTERNSLGIVVIRGNSIDMLEPLEAL
jgi:small nuclear ribonucleoprotein G